jgi:acetyltransferase
MSAMDENDGREQLAELHIPCYQTPESAARALGVLRKYSKVRERFQNAPPAFGHEFQPSVTVEKKRRQASAEELFTLLHASRLPVCPYLLTTDIRQLLKFKSGRGKIVLKIANREIIHKSEHGLVKTGLFSDREIEAAFEEIINEAISLLPEGTTPLILAQEMIEEGVEFILGANEDPHFGKVVMFGIGGIFVELYRDVVFRVLPVDLGDAFHMIGELQGKTILHGFRQFAAIDREKLAQTIIDFADLIESHPEIAEMDLNPLIWSYRLKKPIVVDSRCTLFT